LKKRTKKLFSIAVGNGGFFYRSKSFLVLFFKKELLSSTSPLPVIITSNRYMMKLRYALSVYMLLTHSAEAGPALWPTAKSPAAITDSATEAFITRLMARMTLAEKVGQTIQADINSIAPADLRTYPIGAMLAGGDSGPGGNARAPAELWVRAIAAYRAAAAARKTGHATIPLLFGIDAVHGNNHIPGATIFPHNVGLGAARDPALIERIGVATAQEVAAIGADWTFGPTVAVPRDVRWGRSYEGYGEAPQIVSSYAGPMTIGLQGELVPGAPLARGHVVGAAKHFVGDGGTVDGRDQGDARISEAELVRVHASGYPPAIDAGVLSVMVSFSSWNGVRDIVNHELLTDVLKNRLGFAGFAVGDWNAHGEAPGCTNTNCPQALIAGLDMFMAPDSWKGLFENTLAEMRSGQIPSARLDDAVRRILRVKLKAGLFGADHPLAGHLQLLGAPSHLALARQAVRESLVLLKNDGVLPIAANAHVLVAGDGADNIAKQCGGWTIDWQGTGNRNSDFPQGQSIYAGIATALGKAGGRAELAPDGRFKVRPDVAIVVFGEDPYAEFQGDIASLEYQPGDKRDLALLRRLRAQHIPVVSVFLSGRPLWTNPEINASDAFVAAWLPGSEGGGVADVLIDTPAGKPLADFTSRLAFSWPRTPDAPPLHREDAGYNPQFPYGYGLDYAHPGVVPALSEAGEARVKPPSMERYFENGRTGRSWVLSAEGAVTLQTIDAGAQENGRLALWNGHAPGTIAISGAPVDLSRQSTGDMTLSLQYRIQTPPAGTVRLTLGCGNGCAGALDATPAFAATPRDVWQTMNVRLSCFVAAGARMDLVQTPFMLTSTGTFGIVFRRVALEPDSGSSPCLGRAK
jgi:beta-glucosidase